MAISPHKNVIVPFLAAEEMEIELNMGSRTHGNNPSASRASSATLGYGYAFTNFFKSELLLTFNQDKDSQSLDHASSNVEAVKWESHLLFTERGEYFIDPGMFWELEKSVIQADAYNLVIGGLFRKDIKKLEVNFNPYFEKSWGIRTSESILMGYQWQGKYRFFQTRKQSTLSIGVQGFGELGQWNHWTQLQDQTHRIGPALFYRWRVHDEKSWNGSVAYLFDVTKRQWTPDDADHSVLSSAQTFRAMIEFQF